MIKSVTITNHLNESITLDLFEPDKSGFIILSIDGLGPVKANVNFTELATNDGAIDNSARLDSRNIVLKLQFIENPTIEDTRLLSYKYFPIKRNITFLIETDNRICKAVGRVEKNEPDIFSDKEGCQISIMCPNPYFYSTGDTNEVIFYGTKPLFEFPFSNESLTEKLIEFGAIENQTEGTVYYDGDSDVGVIMTIHSIGEASGVQIYNMDTRKVMSIDDDKFIALMGSGIQAGDEIIINTNRSTKGIWLLRKGETTNILNTLGKPIDWFRLTKGENHFAYTAKAGLSNLQFRIGYDTIYEGV